MKRKEQSSRFVQPKGIGLIKAKQTKTEREKCQDVDACFKPFVFDARISLTGMTEDQRSVQVLRDTACSQSIILASALPFSEQSACGFGAVLRGIEMGYIPRPVHNVHIESDLVTGFFPVAVCAALPIQGVILLVGNDIAGGKVTPALEVLDSPPSGTGPLAISPVFPACVLTRARARMMGQKSH